MSNNIKPQYDTPILYLYDASKNLKHIFTSQDNYKTIYDVVLKQTMNDCTELSFKILFDNDVISYDSCEKMMKIYGDNTWFIIKTVQLVDEENNVLQVTTRSEEVALKGVLCSTIVPYTTSITLDSGTVGTTTTTDNSTGTVTIETITYNSTLKTYTKTTSVTEGIGLTPEQMWNLIKSKVKSCDISNKYTWGGTDLDSTIKRSIQVDDEQSVFENILAMCKSFDGWVEFNHQSDGTIKLYLRTKAIDNGKFVMKGRDLKNLDITLDSTDIVTRLYAFGATDENGIELNIMSVSEDGKSFLENYDYYLSLGMSLEEIANEPRCLQEKIYRDDVFTEAVDLYNQAVKELNKVCVPKLTGSISMVDFGVLEDTSISSPVIGENVKVINIDTKYVMDSRIDSISRKITENPFDIDVTISNLISYSSIFRDLVISSTTLDKITTTTSEGTSVKDTSVTTTNSDGQSFSLKAVLDEHSASIEGLPDSIKLSVMNDVSQNYSTIEMTEEGLSTKVSSGEGFSSEMKQNSEAFQYLFSASSSYIQMDSNGIACIDPYFGLTRLGAGGLCHIDDATGLNPKQYYYLTEAGFVYIHGNDDTTQPDKTVQISIQNQQFRGKPAYGMVSLRKLNIEGRYTLYWASSKIENINTNTMTADIIGDIVYRDIDNSFETVGGDMLISYLILA